MGKVRLLISIPYSALVKKSWTNPIRFLSQFESKSSSSTIHSPLSKENGSEGGVPETQAFTRERAVVT